MDNHYHLLVEVTELNLSRAIQWLNVSYSVWFNRRHERSGHVFAGRFKSVLVDPVAWGPALSRYVHLNPVRVGGPGSSWAGNNNATWSGVGSGIGPRAERLSRLRRYRWSRIRPTSGWRPDWLTCGRSGLCGRRDGGSGRAYREYVEQAVREGLPPSPWEQLRERGVLAGEGFFESLREQIRGDTREDGSVRRPATARPTLAEVIGGVERLKGEPWEAFQDRHGDSGRDLVLYLGRRICGLRLRSSPRWRR
jgi:hypothetical protein